MIKALMLSVVLLFLAPSSAPQSLAQQPKETANWDSFRFLLGEWVGEGTGAPGEGTGGFSFSFDLQGKILVRKNRADYPATKDKPAYSHTDLMVIYREGDDSLKAIYFDNEGHVIHYAVSFSTDRNTLTFLSDPSPSSPRFRFIYSKATPDKLKLEFDIAQPGKPEAFSKYIEGSAHRKPASK
jgi:hypothetical protein